MKKMLFINLSIYVICLILFIFFWINDKDYYSISKIVIYSIAFLDSVFLIVIVALNYQTNKKEKKP